MVFIDVSNVAKCKEHVLRHLTASDRIPTRTDMLKRQARTNIKLFVYLVTNWTKRCLSLFSENEHTHSRENHLARDASPRKIIYLEQDRVLTCLCARVLVGHAVEKARLSKSESNNSSRLRNFG